MRRIEKLLAPDEQVHLVTREHGVVLVGAFVRALLTLAAAGLVAELMSGQRWLWPAPAGVGLLAGLIAAFALLRLVRRVSAWHRRRLVITDRKVMLVRGGLRRDISALPITAIEEVAVARVGRALGLHCGAIVITTNGRRAPLFGLRRLPDPDLVFGLLMGLSQEAVGRARAPMPAARWAGPQPAHAR
jgi:hypothetical protein